MTEKYARLQSIGILLSGIGVFLIGIALLLNSVLRHSASLDGATAEISIDELDSTRRAADLERIEEFIKELEGSDTMTRYRKQIEDSLKNAKVIEETKRVR